MRQTAKAEAYIRFSQQLATRSNSVAPNAYSAFNPPVAQKRPLHEGKQFKSMTHGRSNASMLSSMSPGFGENQEGRESSSTYFEDGQKGYISQSNHISHYNSLYQLPEGVPENEEEEARSTGKQKNPVSETESAPVVTLLGDKFSLRPPADQKYGQLQRISEQEDSRPTDGEPHIQSPGGPHACSASQVETTRKLVVIAKEHSSIVHQRQFGTL